MASSLASSTRKRGSTVAGSATTRSRRQAGPPPLAIDWRTSTTRAGGSGRCRRPWRSSQAQTLGVSRASVGQDQRHAAVGQGHQLGVEQIGADRVGEADRGSPAPRRSRAPGSSRSQRRVEAGLVGERLLMGEQHMLVGDRDDVVVEGAGGDRLLRLLRRTRSAPGRAGGSRAIARDASTCWRAGKAPPRDAIDEDLDAPARRGRRTAAYGWPRLRRRTSAGPGAWTAKCRSSAKARRSWASVAGHSWLRCAIVLKLATVRWQRPSAVSGAGETVAALAAHIAEADKRIGGAAACRRSLDASVPSAASQARLGRRCGQEQALRQAERQDCARILATPCSAAARG